MVQFSSYKPYRWPTFASHDHYNLNRSFSFHGHTPVWLHTVWHTVVWVLVCPYMQNNELHCLDTRLCDCLSISHDLAHARVPCLCGSNAQIVSYTAWTYARVSARVTTSSYFSHTHSLAHACVARPCVSNKNNNELHDPPHGLPHDRMA